MLRIKKEVNLNELKKFGFTKFKGLENSAGELIKGFEYESYMVEEKGRRYSYVFIPKDTREISGCYLEKIYDLIQARIGRESGGIIWK